MSQRRRFAKEAATHGGAFPAPIDKPNLRPNRLSSSESWFRLRRSGTLKKVSGGHSGILAVSSGTLVNARDYIGLLAAARQMSSLGKDGETLLS
jgi:hypothetical protein